MNLFRCTFINAVRELKSSLSAQLDYNCKSIQIIDGLCIVVSLEDVVVVVPLSNVISAEKLEDKPQPLPVAPEPGAPGGKPKRK